MKIVFFFSTLFVIIKNFLPKRKYSLGRSIDDDDDDDGYGGCFALSVAADLDIHFKNILKRNKNQW